MTKPTGVGRGGARPGAGRPRKPRPPPLAEVAPVIQEELAGLRTLLREQNEQIAEIRQHRRDERESGPLILRRLVELEKLVRGDPGLSRPARHSRARPLGIE